MTVRRQRRVEGWQVVARNHRDTRERENMFRARRGAAAVGTSSTEVATYMSVRQTPHNAVEGR